MKTIGLIGGISWQSTIDYYRIINEAVTARTNGKHSARILIDSLDFGDIEDFMLRKDFEGLTRHLAASARKLEQAGAELLMIGANTMHFFAPGIQEAIQIPVVSIIEATIDVIKTKHMDRVGLLATKFTMEEEFYKKDFIMNGIDIIVPPEVERNIVQHVIFEELHKSILNPDSKQKLLSIINWLVGSGAQGIILGCTEIPLLIKQSDCDIPVFDTTEIHALAAVERAL
ncbi:MAG: aspartate/glutamate racemase family protein [Bacteroidetes bacterium]|nr:aspartate/glutamate racemase family protein [Bacteroidota bacterium]